jgi:hypothetical protein
MFAEAVSNVPNQDDKAPPVKKRVYKPVYEQHSEQIVVSDDRRRVDNPPMPAASQVFEAEGKKLSSDEVWKRVVSGRVVLVSGDGKEVDTAYRSTLAKDTLIFVSPPQLLGGPEGEFSSSRALMQRKP